MPDPSNYSSEDEWMEACVPAVVDEGKPRKQAVAQCLQMWRDKALASPPRPLQIGECKNIPPTMGRDKDASTASLYDADGRFIETIDTSPPKHVRGVLSHERAWSVLTVKSVDTEQRTIEGIASTPSVDRMGDIVEPLGAKFTLPIPLLHHHDHKSPVGHVVSVRVSKDGITIKAKLAREDEPGPLKDRLDTAWQELKHGLVRGLSIGFQPLEYEALKEGGIRFIKWGLHELSLVTIPAQAEAQISLIKSLDVGFQAEHGQSGTDVSSSSKEFFESGAGKGTRKAPSTSEKRGTSISLALKERPQMSKTVTEQIAALEAKCAANQERMQQIMAKAMEEDRSTHEGEQDEFDTLERENEQLAGDLKRFKSLERTMQATAKPVEQVKSAQDASAARAGSPVRVSSPKPPPGVRFARMVKCLGMAQGNRGEAAQLAEQLYGDDQGVVGALKMASRVGDVDSGIITKAAVDAGGTNTWASFLVGDETSAFADFAEFLRPQTIIGQFGNNGVPALRQVPFRVPLLLQTTGGDAFWTGEGAGKGVTKFDGQRTTLEPLKVANIAVLTNEVIRDSSPSAEVMVRDQLAAALRARIDQDFIDPANAGSAVKPASITNGVTATASSGVTDDAVRADFQAMMAPFIDADNPPGSAVLIMAASTALSLSLMTNEFGTAEFPGISMAGGNFRGIPVIVSEYVGTSGGSPNTRYVWLVNASDIYLGDDDGVAVRMSNEASLQMDSAPTNASIESGSPSGAVPTTLVSMFQTNSSAFLCERTINWKLRRTSAVSGLSGVAWGT